MAPPSSVFGPENAEMAILPPKIRLFSLGAITVLNLICCHKYEFMLDLI